MTIDFGVDLGIEFNRKMCRFSQFRLQSRNITRSLAKLFTEEDSINAERCGGGAICPDCSLEYNDHPWIEEGVAKGLTVTCQGKLVKL